MSGRSSVALLCLLFLLPLFSFQRANALAEQEAAILLQAKGAAHLDDPHGRLNNWLPRTSPCNWAGVTCDPLSGAVVSIDISSAGIVGGFPSGFCRVPTLRWLSLANNLLNGTLSVVDVAPCARLRHLNLSSNDFVGRMPEFVPVFEDLQVLDLSQNNFSGGIPPSFGTFPSLRVLNLFGNYLTGIIPPFLGNLSELQQFNLAYNTFDEGPLPPEIGNLTKLVNLWLPNSNLVGGIPESIGNLVRLINLDLSSNKLTGRIPDSIGRLGSIQQIELYGNYLSEIKMDSSEIEVKKKAKSNDPGWKYAHWPNEHDKNKIKCDLCGLVTNGGIKRQKEHLIGGFSDVKKCPKTTKEIAEEMLAWLNKNKKRKMMSSSASAGASACGAENIISSDEETAIKLQESSQASSKKYPIVTHEKKHTKGPMDIFARMSVEDFVDARRSGKQVQSSIDSKLKKDEREKTHEAIATWFYEGGVPFNAAKLKSFEIMVESIGRFGPGLKPPSYHMLRMPLLKRMVEKTKKMQGEYLEHWKMYGCTIMCDGWTDKRQRKLINFLVNCPEGTFFMESFDVSHQKEDAGLLYELLDKMVEKVGEDHVVQVVTDNASYNIAAGRMLMEKRKKLFWTPCAAHCLDLMLEDIGKMKEYAGVITKAKKLTAYVYTHTRLLDHMRRETKGKELVRFGVTRFATAFLTLERLHDETVKRGLRRLFSSSAWYNSAWAKTNAGKNISSIVFQVKFWHGVEEILRACQPILQVLRLVDGDEKPAMGYLYAAMELARNQIIENFNSRQTKYQAILKIVDKRWKDQMNRPLHEAGFFLNPKLYFDARQKDACGVTKFGSAFMRCLEKMETDKDVQDKIGDQMMMYSCARGSFGNPMAIRARERRLPTDWWLQYGVDTPELQSFALRILGLCCSSSGCERNWSVFEFIHTKKRNRLEHKRLNDLVFVQYNRRLRERFNERKNHPERYDPICLEDLDWGSSWMTKDGQDLVHDGEDLTWADVDQAMGASLERIRRGKMNMIATSSQSMTMGDDEDEELLEEEDEDTNDDDGGNWEESNGEEDEDYGGGEKASDMGEKELENAMFGFRI